MVVMSQGRFNDSRGAEVRGPTHSLNLHESLRAESLAETTSPALCSNMHRYQTALDVTLFAYLYGLFTCLET
jgi:hypothetical protein